MKQALKMPMKINIKNCIMKDNRKTIMRMCEKFLKAEDKYPKMTEEAINELWNNDKFSKEGLWCIAFALLKKLLEN